MDQQIKGVPHWLLQPLWPFSAISSSTPLVTDNSTDKKSPNRVNPDDCSQDLCSGHKGQQENNDWLVNKIYYQRMSPEKR